MAPHGDGHGDDEIQIELPLLLRQYKSGRVERLFPSDAIPAGVDAATGVASKDVLVDPSTGVSVRLHLPNLPESDRLSKKKLPVFVYFHGGGFVVGSAFDTFSHVYLNLLASRAEIIAVSVDYRLAPEHPLPAAYEDSLAGLRWVLSHAGGAGPEEWLVDHGDFSLVFLSGGSAGANIAHQVALLAGAERLPTGARIEALVLFHPYFWGAKPIGAESRDAEFRKKEEAMWRLVCPGTAGLCDPRIDPLAEGAPSLKGLACGRVLVAVAEKDWLRWRGLAYAERLKENGWPGEVVVVETEGEEHAFYAFKPTCDKATELMDEVVAFLHGRRRP